MNFLDNVAIGTDIEKVERFNNPDKAFLEKIYTTREIEYCINKSKPEQSFAVRYCAKEAVIKALSGLDIPAPAMSEIEVISKKNGFPMVKLKNNKNINVKVSLSHTENMAVAFVMLEKTNV